MKDFIIYFFSIYGIFTLAYYMILFKLYLSQLVFPRFLRFLLGFSVFNGICVFFKQNKENFCNSWFFKKFRPLFFLLVFLLKLRRLFYTVIFFISFIPFIPIADPITVTVLLCFAVPFVYTSWGIVYHPKCPPFVDNNVLQGLKGAMPNLDPVRVQELNEIVKTFLERNYIEIMRTPQFKKYYKLYGDPSCEGVDLLSSLSSIRRMGVKSFEKYNFTSEEEEYCLLLYAINMGNFVEEYGIHEADFIFYDKFFPFFK